MNELSEKLKLLPTNPGVYVMLDSQGQVIYVGKAKNLKNRVRQYFFSGVKTEKVMAMVSHIADFYYIITPSEIDALSLENNLIKKHKPKYNILLKDDKTYPYLKIDLKCDYPNFTITRKLKKDGAKYFGPFMGGISVNEVLSLVNGVFKLRPCDKKLNKVKPLKPCLNYHLKNCLAPCAFLVSKEEYRERVDKAISFLSGEVEETEKLLREEMLLRAEKEEFERALKCKELLSSLEKIKLKRITSLNKFIDADVIAHKTNGIYSVINLLIVRKGRMLGSKNFSMTALSTEDSQVISQFISGYYKENSDIPEEIILPCELEDTALLEDYFKKILKTNVNILHAKQGVRASLVDMAEINAEEHLVVAVDRIKHKEDMTIKACSHLQKMLNLKNYPKRMECYDISNISGVDKVGSMVVFIDGEKEPNEYRRFKITSFDGPDDFRSLREVLTRRFNKLSESDEKFPKPDLIVIDGGKGQLSTIVEVFKEFNIEDIDLISLAEREEEVFLPNRSEPVIFERRDYALKMLQRIRDEAHRFAITYHRTLRGKRALSSVLDEVEGLGKVKIKALLEEFKDISGIANAKKEELLKVKGIGEKQAENIIRKLKEKGLK